MKKIISVIICLIMIITAAVSVLANDVLLTEEEVVVGDMNGDKTAYNKDVVTLFRYVSSGERAEDESVYDFNGDTAVDNKDVVALFRYLSRSADDTAEETETEPEGSETEPDETETEDETGFVIDENDPEWINGIKIGTREELLEFANKVNGSIDNFSGKTIWITEDIDLDPDNTWETNWNPLSTAMLEDATINGAGHTITGMRMKPAQVSGPMGFIGKAANKITIKNLTFDHAVLEGAPKHSGIVIGELSAGGQTFEIENVKVTNSIVSGEIGEAGNIKNVSFRLGGIVGANIYGDTVYVHGCTVDGIEICGFHNIAGLVGCTLDGKYVIEDNTVKNASLIYSASFSTSYPADASRYFADPFYEVTNYWGEYHTDVDLKNGNNYETIDSWDIVNDLHYDGEEGKSDDYPGQFPAKDSITRPKDDPSRPK